MIFSNENSLLFGALFTVFMCLTYLLLDGYRLIRALKGDDPDEKFGFVISMVIVAIGVTGVVKHYWIS